MSIVSLKDAKTALSSLIDDAIKGEFVTITRYGRPAAVLVSLEAAEAARKALRRSRPGLVAYLRTFPDGDFDRSRSRSRNAGL